MRYLVPTWLRPADSDTRRRLLLLALTGLAAMQLGFLTFSPHQGSLILRYAGYPILALTFAVWLGAFWSLRPSAAEARNWTGREGRAVLAWAVGFTLLAALTSP